MARTKTRSWRESSPSEDNVARESQGGPKADNRRQMMIGETKLVLESSDRQVLQLAHQQLETFFSRNNNVRLVTSTDDNRRSTRANPAPAQVNNQILQVNYSAPEMSSSSLKYSREALLTLANNTQSQVGVKCYQLR